MATLPYSGALQTRLRRILSAARRERNEGTSSACFTIPHYWSEITARDSVLRDYFLVRVAQNEKIQKALLSKFKDATGLGWLLHPGRDR